jgi:hypothetical protein
LSSDLQKLKSGSHDDLADGFFNGIDQLRTLVPATLVSATGHERTPVP